ncbi:helix-turn-helix domain-containing protein [Thermodesulfobacteriota bacterium]
MPKTKPYKPDMTTIDVARVLDMSPDEVAELARKGILRGKKVGNRWKFKKRDVLLLSKRLHARN